MNLGELISRYRAAAQDDAVPPFCSDEELGDHYNEAQDEAAIRRRLLRATAESAPTLCAIEASAGTASYSLAPEMFEVTYQAWRETGTTGRTALSLKTREWLDANVRDWRDLEAGTPVYLLKDGHTLQLVPAPAAAGQVLLEGFHVPVQRMTANDAEPGIPHVHHIHLIQWALYRAFSKPDADNFDPARASIAEDEFTRYFGPRPDADLRCDTREDVPQHVEAYWP